MKAWESIQKSLQWLEDNLDREINIGLLAESAYLSPFYYQRLFSRLVGRPVMEYVKLRRLSKAADYLAKNQDKILDTALKFGFENHETFTRNFKEFYGLIPESFRENPRPLSHFLMPDLSLNYYLVEENVPLSANGIILEIHRKTLDIPRTFSGLTVQNPIADTPGIDLLGELWSRFHDIKQIVEGLLPEGNEIGVSYAGETEKSFTYFAGAELQNSKIQNRKLQKSIPKQELKTWTLQNGNYIICSFEAENFYLLTTNALNKARDYMFGTWLPHNKLVTEPFMAELYFKTTPEASTMEIWLKVKD